MSLQKTEIRQRDLFFDPNVTFDCGTHWFTVFESKCGIAASFVKTIQSKQRFSWERSPAIIAFRERGEIITVEWNKTALCAAHMFYASLCKLGNANPIKFKQQGFLISCELMHINKMAKLQRGKSFMCCFVCLTRPTPNTPCEPGWAQDLDPTLFLKR